MAFSEYLNFMKTKSKKRDQFSDFFVNSGRSVLSHLQNVVKKNEKNIGMLKDQYSRIGHELQIFG